MSDDFRGAGTIVFVQLLSSKKYTPFSMEGVWTPQPPSGYATEAGQLLVSFRTHLDLGRRRKRLQVTPNHSADSTTRRIFSNGGSAVFRQRLRRVGVGDEGKGHPPPPKKNREK